MRRTGRAGTGRPMYGAGSEEQCRQDQAQAPETFCLHGRFSFMSNAAYKDNTIFGIAKSRKIVSLSPITFSDRPK